MWEAKAITLEPVELDFRSSRQGIRKDRALVADGEPIVNAVGIVELSANPLQTVVCTSCGISACEPGGWVALRSVGEAVVWLPDFEGMAQSESDMNFPGLAGHALRKIRPLSQREIQRDEIEGRADPGDAGHQMPPAQQQIEPLGDERVHPCPLS